MDNEKKPGQESPGEQLDTGAAEPLESESGALPDEEILAAAPEIALTDEALPELTPPPVKKPKKRKKKRRGNASGVFGGLLLAITIVSVSVILSLVIIVAGMDMLGAGKSQRLVDIEIPQDATTEDIARILHEKDVINIPMLFRVISYLQHADGKYQYGVFTIQPSMSYDEIILNLQEIKNVREFVTVTIPEGYTIEQIGALLEESGVCGSDDFRLSANAAAFDYTFEDHVDSNRLKYNKMEGYLFPDTYDFYVDELSDNVVNKFFANFEVKFSQAMYNRAQALDMTLDEVIALASMIQAESGSVEDMKLISSVFHNRIQYSDSFPQLQSDPTTKYVNEVLKANVPKSEYDLYQEVFDAYDTYVGIGLPPGAICNPGLDAIEAALYPEESPYFYFCANIETREVYYAETLEQHEQNLITAGLV